MNLWSDFLTNDTRLVHKWKHYFPIYERHFAGFVYKPVVFLEIGCGLGGSLQMWKRYFGPHATIIGVDIVPECKNYEEDQIEVRIGSQQDTKFLQSLLDEFGSPDIVLDDGSHLMSHMVTTFQYLYPRLQRNGIYMVEDLHAAYWEEYEGGFKRPGTFIEYAKGLIDELNADHARGAITPTEFTSTTQSIHLYDSVAVFERGAHTKKWAPKIGRLDYVPNKGPEDTIGSEPAGQAASVRSEQARPMQKQSTEAQSSGDDPRAALKAMQVSLTDAEDALARMRNSLSWKVTEPIRRLMTAIRSGPRKAR